MDLYRVFKPVIYISRLFCLAPFAAVEDSGSTRYKFSTFWLLYSILGLCASFIFQINLLRITFSIIDSAVYNAISQIMPTATCVANVVAQVLCLNNGKNVIRILDHVSVLDSENFGARVSYYRLYNVFIVLLIYGIISLVAPYIIYFGALNTNSVHSLKFVYQCTLYFICAVVFFLSDTQFIHFVLLLKHRFSVLNDTVINFTFPSLYKTSLNHTIKTPAVDRSVNVSTSTSCIPTTGLKSSLRKVCRHHDCLCDVSESVNRTYSFQILQSVTLNCINVLFTAYYLSTEFSKVSNLKLYSSKQYLFMSALFGLFAALVKVVLLVVVCNRASHEVSGLHFWYPCDCFLNTWPTD